MRYLHIALILLTLSLYSCSESKLPSGILEPEKMQAVYWDYISADVFSNEFIRKDSSKDAALENEKLQEAIKNVSKKMNISESVIKNIITYEYENRKSK